MTCCEFSVFSDGNRFQLNYWRYQMAWNNRTYAQPDVDLEIPHPVSDAMADASPVANVLRALPQTPGTRAVMRREERRWHRSEMIKEFGAWLRDNPETTDLKGLMNKGPNVPGPRSVWMHWSFVEGYGDLWRYSVYFPVTDLEVGKATAHLWIKGSVPGSPSAKIARARDGWAPLKTFPLGEFSSGEELGEAILDFLASKEMDVIYRWMDEPYRPEDYLPPELFSGRIGI
jgi:hypothetical protein